MVLHSPVQQRRVMSTAAAASNDGQSSDSQSEPQVLLRTLRGRRTRLRKQIEADEETMRILDPSEPGAQVQLIALINTLRSQQARLTALDQEILSHPTFEPENEESELDSSEEWARKVLGFIQLGMAQLGLTNDAGYDRLAPNSGGQTAGSPTISAPSPVNNSQPAAALPSASGAVEMTVEPFGENINNSFRIFRAQLTAWINRHPGATKVEKLLFLVSKLRGAPRVLVTSLEMVDSNFDVAMKLLEDNYGQSDQLRRRAMARLSDLPRVRSSTDAVGLRMLLNHIQATTLQLEALGIEPSNFALPFEENVRKAIPAQLLYDFDNDNRRDQLTRSSPASGEPSTAVVEAIQRLQQLTDCLRRYTIHLEETPTTHSHRDPPKPDHRPWSSSSDRPGNWRTERQPPRFQKPTTVAAATNQGPPKQVFSCFFCDNKDHRPSRCNHPLTLQQRKAILARKGKCATCFTKQHAPGQQCGGTRVPCSRCQSRGHYTCMHPPDGPTQLTAVPAVHASSASAVASPSAGATAPLVMTASAFVTYGKVEVPVRVFLDPGSMLTFVAPALIEKLSGIQPSGRADLQVKGVNSQRSLVSDRYRLCLKGRSKNSPIVNISAYAYDFDVDPSNSCQVGTLHAIRRFGKRYPLADASYLDDRPAPPPMILLGMDYFYEVVGRSMRDVTGGLVAMKSALGWVLGGAPRSRDCRVDLVSVHPFCCAAALSKPARDIERLWTTEAIGIVDQPPAAHSADALRR